jgi:hypothetical protein
LLAGSRHVDTHQGRWLVVCDGVGIIGALL